MVQEDPGSVEALLSEAPKPRPIGGLSNGHLFLALTLLTEQGKTPPQPPPQPPISALHHRNVNKLLETLASRPCLFSCVEPWENTTLDSGLLCLFYVLSVRLLLRYFFPLVYG